MTREQFEHSLKKPLLVWLSKEKNEVSVFIGEAVAQMVSFDQRNPHLICFPIPCIQLQKLRILHTHYCG